VAKYAQKFDRFEFMIVLLDWFGKRGGYTKILHLIDSCAQPDSKLDITNLITLVHFVVKTCWHFHRQFSTFFVPALQTAFNNVLKSPNSPFLSKDVTQAQSNMVKEFYEHILARHMVPELVQKAMSHSYAAAYIQLLSVENLERRVDAVTYLKGLIMALKKEKMDDVKNTAAVTKKERALLEVFKEGDVFKLLFSR